MVSVTRASKLVGNIRQNATQHFVAAPNLKAPVHSLVVRIALRQHVPLRTCVEYPQDRFKHAPRRNRFPSRMPVGNVLLRKMIPGCAPIARRSTKSFDIYSRSIPIRNFEIGLSHSA